jgi:hypothetical protein
MAKKASALIAAETYDIVIVDICWGGLELDGQIEVSGRDWASEVRSAFPQEFIILTSVHFPELWLHQYGVTDIRDEFTTVVDKFDMTFLQPPPEGRTAWLDYLDELICDRKRVRSNADLGIRFEKHTGTGDSSPLDITEALDGLLLERTDGPPERLSVRRHGGDSAPDGQRYTDALKSLLQRLFFDFERLSMRFPSGGEGTPRGRSGTNVALCAAEGDGVPADNLVLKFGDPQRIGREYANYHQYVDGRLTGDRHTSISSSPGRWSAQGNAHPRYRRAGPLAGVVYRLIGGEGKAQALEQWIKEPQNEQQLPQVVREIIQLGKRGWYTQRIPYSTPVQGFQYSGVVDYYNQTTGLDASRLKVMLDCFGRRLSEYHGCPTFRLHELPGVSLKNPILSFALYWATQPAADATTRAPSDSAGLQGDLLRLQDPYYCIVHGDLNLGNILIDDRGGAWLIDFFRTGPGHLFQDFAELESCLTVQAFEEVPLPEFYHAMRTLLRRTDSLVPAIDMRPFSPSARHLLNTAAALREEARAIAGHERSDEYLVALLYSSLTLLKFYDLGEAKLARALVLSSLLCRRLEDGDT